MDIERDPRLAGHVSEARSFTPERMNALTEGVFAIVLTLLVLELRLPETDESILLLLRDDARVFVAWLISFILIARFWLVHHSVTAGLRQCRMATLTLNLAVLCAVSLVPFSADVVGTQRIAEPWSTVVFATNVGLLSISVGLLAGHVLRESHLLHPEGSTTALARHRRRHLYVLPFATLSAVALAFVHPYLAAGVLLAEFLSFVWGERSVPAARSSKVDARSPRC
jgi:uncharacterized membrane protein